MSDEYACAEWQAGFAEWPERPITMVVPFAAGGGSDLFAHKLREGMNQNRGLRSGSVSIVNVGTHWSVGTRQAKDAAADGHTFLLTDLSLMGPSGVGGMDFSWRDFRPVAAVGEFGMVPVIHKELGIRSYDELIALAKSKPGVLTFGANLGALSHLAGIAISVASNAPAYRYVQTGGARKNFVALLSGQIDITVMSPAELLKFHCLPSGTANPDSPMIPLAYSGTLRIDALKDLPTLKEIGVDIEFTASHWIFAQKATPDEIVENMALIIRDAVKSDSMIDWMSTCSMAPIVRIGKELDTHLENMWRKVEPLSKIASTSHGLVSYER